MYIIFYINRSKTKAFYLQIGRRTPSSWCAYPISWGTHEYEEGECIYATIKVVGKKKYS